MTFSAQLHGLRWRPLHLEISPRVSASINCFQELQPTVKTLKVDSEWNNFAAVPDLTDTMQLIDRAIVEKSADKLLETVAY